MLKDIKAITMVRNDVFLRRWVEYYGRELGKENLYVYFDGTDQEIPDYCQGVNTFLCEKMRGEVVRIDKLRSRFLSAKAAELFKGGADMVIGTDADEYLVVDPVLGVGLREFLSRQPASSSYSALGVDVIHQLGSEDKLDFNKPFLGQRHHGWLYSRYTKPSVITRPVTWGSGFHRVKGHDFGILPGLYLFHFGASDLESLRDTSNDPARKSDGWNRHQLKRQRAVLEVTKLPQRSWDATVGKVRRMQVLCRPIFAINKPTTFGIKYVVRIPDRFDNIV